MKIIISITLIILFCTSCSPVTNQSLVTQVAPLNTLPTAQNTETPTPDPLLTKIINEFSSSPHASENTCENCHDETFDYFGGGFILKDNANSQIKKVSTSTELCKNCHSSINFPDATESSSGLAHTGDQCTSCHNAHTTQASCTQSDCHYNVRTTLYAQIERPEFHPTTGDTTGHMCDSSGCHNLVSRVKEVPIYHQPIHKNVPCYICHDQSNHKVTLSAENIWVSINEVEPDYNPEQQLVSHAIGKEVVCSKCHYPGNRFLLTEIHKSD